MGPEPLHAGEPDTTEATLRSLLAEQRPEWEHAPASYQSSTGTSNTIWRVRPPGHDLAVRLPRTASAARSVSRECALLPEIARAVGDAFAVPRVVVAGRESEAFPYPWAALAWIDGDDLWANPASQADQSALADELARVVNIISSITSISVPDRLDGTRGGAVGPLLDVLDRWLTDPAWNAAAHLDVAAVRRAVDRSSDAALEPHTARAFTHGDLIPGNVLMANGRLSAVIDWGAAGNGDPAVDLAPAWSVLDPAGRARFRSVLEIDEPTWHRAKLFELEHSVGGIVYYAPRRHPLADVMRATLARILDDPS